VLHGPVLHANGRLCRILLIVHFVFFVMACVRDPGTNTVSNAELGQVKAQEAYPSQQPYPAQQPYGAQPQQPYPAQQQQAVHNGQQPQPFPAQQPYEQSPYQQQPHQQTYPTQ
jgi:hypothetical protein